MRQVILFLLLPIFVANAVFAADEPSPELRALCARLDADDQSNAFTARLTLPVLFAQAKRAKDLDTEFASLYKDDRYDGVYVATWYFLAIKHARFFAGDDDDSDDAVWPALAIAAERTSRPDALFYQSVLMIDGTYCMTGDDYSPRTAAQGSPLRIVQKLAACKENWMPEAVAFLSILYTTIPNNQHDDWYTVYKVRLASRAQEIEMLVAGCDEAVQAWWGTEKVRYKAWAAAWKSELDGPFA